MALAREIGRFFTPELLCKRLSFRAGDDKVIVFDSGSSPEYLNWLCDKYPEKRVILFFWNPIWPLGFDRLNPRIEIWTYSKRDSLKYNIRFNSQFYFDVLADEAKDFLPPPFRLHPKVLFVGREKGRADALKELYSQLEDAGAEIEQFLVPFPKHLRRFAHLVEKTVPYRDVVEMMKRADIILDYSTDPEAGLSLRAMESLFWGKKLITNNISILDTDFYHPGNIYVLGKDKRSFEDFFRCDPTPVAQPVRDRYRLSHWLKRFDEVTECSIHG